MQKLYGQCGCVLATGTCDAEREKEFEPSKLFGARGIQAVKWHTEAQSTGSWKGVEKPHN